MLPLVIIAAGVVVTSLICVFSARSEIERQEWRRRCRVSHLQTH